MRETMLLQYADDIVKVEMGSLRGEMLRLVGLNESVVTVMMVCFYDNCNVSKKCPKDLII